MTLPWLIAIMGPTGSGKSSLAEHVATRLGAQLVNADAFQVYRGFDIGTNKPADRERYALLDLKDPHESYGVGEFVLDALAILERCWSEGKSVVLVGGTGLYVRALMEEYREMAAEPSPELRAQVQVWLKEEGVEGLARRVRELDPAVSVDWNNPVRVGRALERALCPGERIEFNLPRFHKLKLGLDIDLEVLRPRLLDRTQTMMEAGWVAEVARFAASGGSPDVPAMRAIGYLAIWEQLHEGVGFEETLERIHIETRQYAKRQKTWLKSEPNLVPVEAHGSYDEVERRCAEILLAKGALVD